MIELLRKYTPNFMTRYRVAAQVKSVLAKIMLCRTPTLKGRMYECPQCDERCPVYNSCVDRHCPQCAGARRASWLDKTAELLLPGVVYFQVVFTLPEPLWPLMLGSRKPLFDLLFRSAWRALSTTLREQGQFEPAAVMVLHT